MNVNHYVKNKNIQNIYIYIKDLTIFDKLIKALMVKLKYI